MIKSNLIVGEFVIFQCRRVGHGGVLIERKMCASDLLFFDQC